MKPHPLGEIWASCQNWWGQGPVHYSATIPSLTERRVLMERMFELRPLAPLDLVQMDPAHQPTLNGKAVWILCATHVTSAPGGEEGGERD